VSCSPGNPVHQQQDAREQPWRARQVVLCQGLAERNQRYGLEPFRVVSDLRARKSWAHEPSEAELQATEPLMRKIVEF
jgi:hypothetical protein